ncbi:MAG: hypothetical protein ACYDGR_17350 [Candidatus Dormibacteria bacterium]
MPRRRPPVEIFTAPIPPELAGKCATCPMCSGKAEAIGFVVDKLVYRCTQCSVRFKGNPQPQSVTRREGVDRP